VVFGVGCSFTSTVFGAPIPAGNPYELREEEFQS
jgi:hypothetical protein